MASKQASAGSAKTATPSLQWTDIKKGLNLRPAKVHLASGEEEEGAAEEQPEARRARRGRRRWCSESTCSRRSSTGFWIDCHQARVLVYMCTFLNAMFLVSQVVLADILVGDEPRRVNRLAYFAIELCFVLAQVAELVMRCGSPSLQSTAWNRYDAILLLLCFTDCCILVFIGSAADVHRLMLRLLPALQMFRLGRFMQEMDLIVQGLLSTMRAVLWALLLLALVIYVFAVLSTSYIRHREQFKEDQLAEKLFGSLPSAMLTFFTFASLEDFSEAVRHFMTTGGASGAAVSVGIVVFILVTNLSLLNLVTAIMVDGIIDVLPKRHSEGILRERANTAHRLKTIFLGMDGDGDRKLTMQELRDGVDGAEEVEHELKKLQIAVADAWELFTLINFNGEGSVSVDEFISGLLRMVHTPASKKELLCVEYDMRKMWSTLGSGQERITAGLEEGFRQLLASFEGLLQGQCSSLEQCIKDCCMRVDQQSAQHWDALAQQLRLGQQQVLEKVMAASCSSALTKCTGVVSDCMEAVAKVQHSLEADAKEALHKDQLIEQLKEGQQQLLEAVQKSLGRAGKEPSGGGLWCSSPSPHCPNQRARPPPLQSSCLASSLTTPTGAAATADVGTQSEPHSVLPTPAMPGDQAMAHDAAWGCPQTRLSPLAPAPVLLAPGSPPRRQPPPQLQFGAATCASWAPMEQPSSGFASSPASGFQWAGGGLSRHDGAAAGGLQMPAQVPAILQQPRGQLQVPAAGCMPQGHGHGRVALVQQWVRQQGWDNMAFDKLVLHLDRLSVELSEDEQDALQLGLRYPNAGFSM